MALEGTFTPPGGQGPIPPPTPADMAMEPADHYGGLIAIDAWIRRAVHAERFAKALEVELENLRAKVRAQS